MKKAISILLIMSMVYLMCGCQNNTSKTDISGNGRKPIEEKSTALAGASENANVTDEFLQDRYPNKKVLHWVYGEGYSTSDILEEDGELYDITKNQIILLNDYLVSLDKDYVVNFVKFPGGDEYIQKVKEDDSVDIISAGTYNDENAKVWNRVMKYDFIHEGLLEELTPYLKEELKQYKNSIPDNEYKLSQVNGKFYGFDNIYGGVRKRYWYVNTEVAEKYDINLNNMKQMNFEDWEPYLDKVYQGEKKAGTENFKIISDYTGTEIENTAFGYIGELSGTSWVHMNSLGLNVENKILENKYANPEVKKIHKTYADYYKKGYYNYLNPETENEDSIDTGNCFLILNDDMSEKETVEDLADTYSQVKKVKKIYYNTEQEFGNQEQAGITGICSKSTSKKQAIDAINTIYSDEITSMITYYPQYNIGDDKRVISEEDIVVSDYENYAGPSRLLTNLYIISSKDWWMQMDEMSVPDKFAGKVYDYTQIEDKIRKIEKVEKKYMNKSGELKKKFLKKDFEKVWSQFLKALDEAGINEVVEYLNQQ